MDSKYWTSTKEYPTRGEIKEIAKTLICPKCGVKGMNVRWSKEQPFFGCTEYPECRGSRNWYAEIGFSEEHWQDILRDEGKIEPNPTPSKRNQETSHDWKEEFLKERAFVMQQLTDVKAAHTQRLHHCERLEKEIKVLRERVDRLCGWSKATGGPAFLGEEEKDDIPF